MSTAIFSKPLPLVGLAKLKLTASMARREESRKVIDRAAAQMAAKGATSDVKAHLKKFESKIEMDKSGAVGTPAWYGCAPELVLFDFLFS